MKICVKRRCVVIFLALFSLSVILINTIPLFPTDTMRLPPRELSLSTRDRGWPAEGTDSTGQGEPLPLHGHSRVWKHKPSEINAKHKPLTRQKQRDVGISKNVAKNIHVDSLLKLKHRQEAGPVEAKEGLSSRGKAHPLHSNVVENKLFSGSSAIPFKAPLSHSIKAPVISQTAGTLDSAKGARPCQQKCPQDGGGHGSVPLEEAEAAQQTVREVSGEETRHEGNAKGFWKRRSHSFTGKESIPRELRPGRKKLDLCQESDDTWNETAPEDLQWFSTDDVRKMAFLSGTEVLSKARVPGHGQVLQVGLGAGRAEAEAVLEHRQRCQEGLCALIKRPSDWFEVLAFHLDRVLGLNRSIPSVLRNFQSQVLPYRYTSGTARPVVWWDPGIQHLAEADNDQNSFSLTWPQYQRLLRSRCGLARALNATPCVGVQHFEWGRLALFDFLLQVR